jgi:hypothetical protein
MLISRGRRSFNESARLLRHFDPRETGPDGFPLKPADISKFLPEEPSDACAGRLSALVLTGIFRAALLLGLGPRRYTVA